MAVTNKWKKGRGKLGLLEPLLGNWHATADSPIGTVSCTRSFEKVLGGNYIKLTATWDFGGKTYEELAIFGSADGKIRFKSFTSDGKHSEGAIDDGSDVHPDAICFVAQMAAGTARMVYWPAENGGFNWVVESKNKKGWNRFTEHHYTQIVSPT
ncbi:MAG: hypothetical protein EOO51_14015 [Flavobacterium sp.]|nr:MAG: hypothetical protein EOO51_14015 [Flavobacterium sp.]